VSTDLLSDRLTQSDATDSFAPEGTGANCGAACHTVVKTRDYVFTDYGER